MRRPMKLLSPFGRSEGLDADRLAAGDRGGERARPRARGIHAGLVRRRTRRRRAPRYAAVGFVAGPDSGVDEGRAFVVDVRSGHVIWRRPIEHRADLPRSVTALGT